MRSKDTRTIAGKREVSAAIDGFTPAMAEGAAVEVASVSASSTKAEIAAHLEMQGVDTSGMKKAELVELLEGAEGA